MRELGRRGRNENGRVSGIRTRAVSIESAAFYCWATALHWPIFVICRPVMVLGCGGPRHNDENLVHLSSALPFRLTSCIYEAVCFGLYMSDAHTVCSPDNRGSMAWLSTDWVRVICTSYQNMSAIFNGLCWLGEVLMGYFYQNTETSTVPTSTWNLSCNAALMGIVPPLINASTCCGAKITYLAFPSSFIIISTETHFKATATTGSAHMLTILQVGIWVPVSRQSGCTRRVFPLGPFKCYVTLFFWKLDPHPPPRNANNIEHYTFITLSPRKSDTPPTPICIT